LQNGKEPLNIVRAAKRNWFPHIDCFAHLLPRNMSWEQRFDYLTSSAEKENPASFSARKKVAS
jgi:hypothetical protein